MKKIYLLLFLLVSGLGFAQIGNYRVVTKLSIKPGSGSYGGDCRNDVKVALVYNDGPTTVIDQNISGIPSDRYTLFEVPLEISATRKPLKVQVSSSRNWKRTIGGCGGNGSFNGDLRESTQFNSCMNTYTDMVKWWEDELSIENVPVLTIIDPGEDDELPTEKNITIKSHTGFLLSEYNWQYSFNPLDPNSWIDMPQFSGKSSFTTNAKGILGENAAEYHGRKIYFRQKACNTFSDAVYYIIRQSAPEIVSKTEEKTKCVDSKDGKLVLEFNRPLFVGEKMTFSIIQYDEVRQEWMGVVCTFQEPEDEISLDGTNSYEFPCDFSKGKYGIAFTGFINGSSTGSPHTEQNPFIFNIGSPKPVDFTLKNTNANCIGSGDGTITITPTGGTRDVTGNDYYSLDNGVNWIAFSNNNSHIITGLIPGTYNIKVKDMNGCIARNQTLTDGEIGLGDEKIVTAMISEPAAPVSLSFTSIQEPAFFGGSNGKITASITGGTPFSDNSYLYEWRNSKNEIISNAKTTTEFAGDLYAITLHDIPADTYTLTVWDANYNLATNNAGCTILPAINIILTQPDPIVVTFEIKQTISCNVSNEFGNESDINPNDGQRDESQDGILVAHVTGGVPFKGFENNRMSYKYFWKKQQTDGTWISLDDETETAQNLGYGNYALNVEDKNGIILGVYVNNILERETDSIQFMQQPSRLELELIKEDILCSQGDNGWAKVNVTGGTPPYVYEWTNGKTTDTITQLTSGNYFVKVTDAKGCTVQGSILIEQPNGVVLNETITNPTCFQGNDGLIHLAPTGGVTPYQYSWSTGANTRDISNLAEGNYTVTLTDAQGCIMIQNFEVTAPDPVVIDLGADRTLCLDQVLELNASIPDAKAQYEWTATNGFTSDKPEVSLTKAGTYHVKVTSGFGCTGEDEIVVKTNEAVIDSEFLLSSQAYLDEEVILVNTSNPFGETTKWMIPQNVIILEEKEKYITLQFKDLGTYTISLQQTQGECYAVYTKNITVEKRGILPNTGGATSSFIKDFMVTPNPSDGNFKAAINLENDSPVNLRLFSSNGQYSAIEKKEAGKKNYEIDFNVTLASGIYILVLETAHQTLVKKIIIY